MIPFKVLPIGKEEIKAVAQVMESKNLSMGKKVIELEQAFAEYIGCKYAIAVDSCTSALFLSMKVRGVGKGIKVWIPSMTVPLVASTVIHTGAEVNFVDETDWVGHSYEMSPFNIFDSAHEVRRIKCFEFAEIGTIMCYSFYPTKPISSCEGGMICTNNDEYAQWLKKARWYGRNEGESKIKNSWEYDIEFPGWKMNMTDIQAAIALEHLKKLPYLDAERQRVVDRYNDKLEEKNSSMYLYRINVKNRDEFIRYMDDNDVQCGVHFKPLHLMEAFKACLRACDLVKTEAVGKTTVSLPLYDSLTDLQVDYICDLTNKWRMKN